MFNQLKFRPLTQLMTATHEIPILPLRRGKKMEERIGNPGVKLEFHVWQWLPHHQISDMTVIK